MILEIPAVRGIQAGREYYIAMWPLANIGMFRFSDSALEPELRAQRQLNRGRIPEMARYVIENRENYVFSALTASIDGDVRFVAGEDSDLGVLRFSSASRIVINDGQHRQAAIETALEQRPELKDETIAVVLFHDRGLERCQQMFADLNRYAVRPSRSLSVLYDQRDDQALLAKYLLASLPDLAELVEMEKSSLSPGSKALFTLSALYTATSALLSDVDVSETEERGRLATNFWGRVSAQMREWQMVRDGSLTAGQVRENFIHSHGVVLHSLGRVGNALLKGKGRKLDRLDRLGAIDWRKNAPVWDGRAVTAGRMSKTHQSVLLVANVVKQQLGMPLSAEEQVLEDMFRRDKVAA